MTHQITMPSTHNPIPPTCVCGWAAPLPMACTWSAWERAVNAHLSATSDHTHTHALDDDALRCPVCQEAARA